MNIWTLEFNKELWGVFLTNDDAWYTIARKVTKTCRLGYPADYMETETEASWTASDLTRMHAVVKVWYL